MSILFTEWADKVPVYDNQYKDIMSLFAGSGGSYDSVDSEKKEIFGKKFSTQYEMYTYAFFIGLYNNKKKPREGGSENFSHKIKEWGKKSPTSYGRKEFTDLQEKIFVALVAKADLDLIAIDKGDISSKDVVSSLLKTMEEYTNGGLQLIKQRYEKDRSHFNYQSSFLDFLDKA
jgi:hypothetical protein